MPDRNHFQAIHPKNTPHVQIAKHDLAPKKIIDKVKRFSADHYTRNQELLKTIKANTMHHRLPQEYAALECFVDLWSLPNQAARSLQRANSTPEEREEFFNAVKGHIDSALDTLDKKPLHALNEQEQRLLNLLLSFAHVALAIEIQGNAESRHALSREALKFR